ncbi:hypothetical protein [Leekyejoonella antrihumi]|uniref:Peptidase M48 domain-containing protein n=1 Tax=Leekyejoonella antrihumi TaxID=1660198 RepID=A0A563DWI7_9MICO|nr:hypothetical protein [Leekyejoonella antrihumi]TWP34489.1 hypothetical protein FGL98_17405 [Leekyejoonella antrihumi]
MSDRVHGWVAAGPAALASGMLWLVTAALFPDGTGALLLIAVLAGVLVLAFGCGENAMLRWYLWVRRPTAAQTATLKPALAILAELGGLPAGTGVYVTRSPVAPQVQAVGRRSLMISAGLIEGVFYGRVTAPETAAMLAYAGSDLTRGHTRHQLAAEVATLPWQLVTIVSHAIGSRSMVIPGVRLLWRARGVIGAIAVGQALTHHGPPGVAGPISAAIITGLVVMGYAAPISQRILADRHQALADWDVALLGLGDPLSRLVARGQAGPCTIDRIHRIRSWSCLPAWH